MMIAAHDRVWAGERDLERLGQESARRFAIAEEAGELTMGQILQFPTLPDPNDAA